MQVELRPTTLRDLCYTASNARKIDKREILASGPRNMTEAGYLTWHLLENVGGVGFTVWIDGNPEFSFGFTCQSPLTPWLYSGWAWGSEKTDLCMPTIAAWGAERVIPTLDSLGAVRVEARSISDHHQSHRWLKWMGFRRECDMPSWGRGGETFVLFAWLRQEFVNGQLRGLARSAAASVG